MNLERTEWQYSESVEVDNPFFTNLGIPNKFRY